MSEPGDKYTDENGIEWVYEENLLYSAWWSREDKGQSVIFTPREFRWLR